jgi:hypothetical protein
MRTHKLPFHGAICVVAAVLGGGAVGGCDDDPIPLFDEQGTWALVKFDLDGKGLTSFDVGARAEKFLIHFNQEKSIVAAASCLDSMGRVDLTTTLCDTGTFQCRCFNYTFEETLMTWSEFAPEGGALPPDPPEDAMAQKPGDPVPIGLETYPESGQTYRYSTLPYGLFNSDEETTKYVFQSRGDAAFMATACMEPCGIWPIATGRSRRADLD